MLCTFNNVQHDGGGRQRHGRAVLHAARVPPRVRRTHARHAQDWLRAVLTEFCADAVGEMYGGYCKIFLLEKIENYDCKIILSKIYSWIFFIGARSKP